MDNKLMPGHTEDKSELINLEYYVIIYKLYIYHYNIYSFMYIVLSSPIPHEGCMREINVLFCSVLFDL